MLSVTGKIVIGFPLTGHEDSSHGFAFEALKVDLRASAFTKLQNVYSELEKGSWVLATGIKE
jgi:hypothetical protein